MKNQRVAASRQYSVPDHDPALAPNVKQRIKIKIRIRSRRMRSEGRQPLPTGKATFSITALSLPRGNGFRHPLHPSKSVPAAMKNQGVAASRPYSVPDHDHDPALAPNVKQRIKIKSRIMSRRRRSEGRQPLPTEKGHFSVTALSLPRGNGFRHPLHPYALVSPNGQRANPTHAFCVRRVTHRLGANGVSGGR